MDNVFIERLGRRLKYECVFLNAFEAGSWAGSGSVAGSATAMPPGYAPRSAARHEFCAIESTTEKTESRRKPIQRGEPKT